MTPSLQPRGRIVIPPALISLRRTTAELSVPWHRPPSFLAPHPNATLFQSYAVEDSAEKTRLLSHLAPIRLVIWHEQLSRTAIHAIVRVHARTGCRSPVAFVLPAAVLAHDSGRCRCRQTLDD